MKRIITYLIVVAATVYTAILYGSTSFLMLFYVELFLPVLLFWTLIPVIRGMKMNLSLPVPVVQQGDKAAVWFRTDQGIPFPGGRISVRVEVRPSLQQKSEKIWFHFPIFYKKNPGRTPVMKAEYDTPYAGNVSLQITKVWCSDLLGIMAIPVSPGYWRKQEPVNLLVLPKMCDMPVMVSRQTRDFAGESEEFSKERGGEDASEIFRIREYQPGDKLRSIHWKISAKTGDMMVREQSLPLGCPVDLYLDFYQAPHRQKHKSPKWDNYFQVAASISHSLVREGCRHYIIWFDARLQDVCRCRIENEEDIYEALLQMGHLEGERVKRDLPGLYRKKYHDAPGITQLELKMDLTLFRNGEKLCRYENDTLEKQLGETELVV